MWIRAGEGNWKRSSGKEEKLTEVLGHNGARAANAETDEESSFNRSPCPLPPPNSSNCCCSIGKMLGGFRFRYCPLLARKSNVCPMMTYFKNTRKTMGYRRPSLQLYAACCY